MAMNWGLISDGGMFESLVHCLLFANDPGTLLFGRPGKDSGQDARSSDGKTIYQAKFSADGHNMDSAVQAALKELEAIKKYKGDNEDGTDKHANYKHWKEAKNWVLIANIKLNPNDVNKWQTQVVPKFKDEDLAATYWSLERLEQELIKRPEIADVFFEGENRVLIGLKEARDLLESEAVPESLEIPFIGREDEKKVVINFVEQSPKRILPIVGSVGIGKSRLVYESLLELSDRGWRALWGLPSSMAQSTKWFRLLNGSQKTVVVLEHIEGQQLLRGIMEQLATTERRNWKVLVATAEEDQDVLDPLRESNQASEQLSLSPLSEEDAKQLVSEWFGNQVDERDYRISKISSFIPGWIALVGSTYRGGKLDQLQIHQDNLAELYVRSCLNKISEAMRPNAKTILRWLALWERISVTTDADQLAEFQYLKDKLSIGFREFQDTLRELTKTGLVRNFGVGKRLYSLGQLVVRHQVLAEWLLEKRDSEYAISIEGRKLVNDLAGLDEIPRTESVMFTLAQLSCSRLEGVAASNFLKPVFDQLKVIVREETLLHQERVLVLVEKGGPADPELALEVLIEVRKSEKPPVEVRSFWGQHTHTHKQLLSQIPWMIFGLTEFIREKPLAKRFLKELEWFLINTSALDEPVSGKQPAQLLARILCDSRLLQVFCEPAFELSLEYLEDRTKWPFVRVLVESLMSPRHETTVYTASNTISIQRSVLIPDGHYWEKLKQLREACFMTLQNASDDDRRCELWRSLISAHQALNFAAGQSKLAPEHAIEFDTVLLSDLTSAKRILEYRGTSLEIREAAVARRLWEWYLRFTPPERQQLELAAQACESLYRDLSQWDFRLFFSYGEEGNVEPEREKVADHLATRRSSEEIMAFFDEAEKFLESSDDLSQRFDRGAGVLIANKCGQAFRVIDQELSPITDFVRDFLGRERFADSEFTFGFALLLLRAELKETKSRNAHIVMLNTACSWAFDRAKLLEGIYLRPHPDNVGELQADEFELVLREAGALQPVRQFRLLPPFLAIARERVFTHLNSLLQGNHIDPKSKRDCILGFINIISTVSKWWGWTPDIVPIAWIFDTIEKHDLSGEILEDYGLNSLRERTGFRFPVSRLCTFIRSRMKFDKAGPPYSGFEIFPHDFKVADWFDGQLQAGGIKELCGLSQAKGFVASYLLPKWISQLDPSGDQIADFVCERLSAGAESLTVDGLAQLSALAAPFKENSNAWRSIAMLVCAHAESLNRDERDYIFSCLENNEIKVFSSLPGTVAGQYLDAVSQAEELLRNEPSNSPLQEYRKRAVQKARGQLEHEQERLEEELHD